LLDSLPCCGGGNQAAFIGGLHSLRQDAVGCWAYLNRRLTTNKRIDALGLGHTEVDPIGWTRNRQSLDGVAG